MKSTEGLLDAAREHLRLLRVAHERQTFSDRYYVSMAFSYGLTTDEIADVSGIHIDRVRAILAGA